MQIILLFSLVPSLLGVALSAHSEAQILSLTTTLNSTITHLNVCLKSLQQSIDSYLFFGQTYADPLHSVKESYNSILAEIYGMHGSGFLFSPSPDIEVATRSFYIGALFNDPESLYKLAMMLENRVFSKVKEVNDQTLRSKLFYPDTTMISNKHMTTLQLSSLLPRNQENSRSIELESETLVSSVPLLYYRAARQGHTGAQQALGYKYYFGLGIKKNCVAAAQYYMESAKSVKEAVEMGESTSAHRLWLDKLYYVSSQRHEEFVTSERFRIFQEDVNRGGKGYTKHLSTLGVYYYEGLYPVSKNFTKASHYYKQHLQSHPNNTNSLYHLGVIYKTGGYGVEQDFKKALDYLRRAEELGDAQSTNKIGQMYFEGQGVTRNERKAWDMFKVAANRSVIDADYNLGTLSFVGGQNITKHRDSAYQHFRHAADYGHTLASYNMGIMHWTGLQTVPYSCPLSVVYFKTVSQRDAKDQLNHYMAVTAANQGRYLEATLRYMDIATRGDSSALLNLAMLLDKERPLDPENLAIKRDISEITKYLSRDTNIPSYEFDLNLYLAQKYYDLASIQGQTQASLRLGQFYEYGLTGVKNPNISLTYFKQVERIANNPLFRSLAYYRMAEMYENKEFPQIDQEQSYQQALKFYNKSAKFQQGFVAGSAKRLSLELERSEWWEVVVSLIQDIIGYFVRDWLSLLKMLCVVIFFNVILFWLVRAFS